ncbi:type II toxin-antitoxin system HigB family toxin [Pseudomonas sp. sp1636]|nr:type II toxin-antitoxin system HigB family toxin [Pseudomonas sp. sp1636]
MEKAAYPTPQALKAELRTASILKGSRAVFNIAGHKHRVILAIDHERQLAFIRFVGSHAQYDPIDAGLAADQDAPERQARALSRRCALSAILRLRDSQQQSGDTCDPSSPRRPVNGLAVSETLC